MSSVARPPSANNPHRPAGALKLDINDNNNSSSADENNLPTPMDGFISQLRSIGHSKVNEYRILGAVGKGKFATVYKAEVISSGIIVALKKVQIFDMMNIPSREKCLREIKLLESLQHPHIIRYLDSYIEPSSNELVIVLQWAKGGDLKKILKKKKSELDKKQAEGNDYPGSINDYCFTEHEIWRYTYELSSGLNHMHCIASDSLVRWKPANNPNQHWTAKRIDEAQIGDLFQGFNGEPTVIKHITHGRTYLHTVKIDDFELKVTSNHDLVFEWRYNPTLYYRAIADNNNYQFILHYHDGALKSQFYSCLCSEFSADMQSISDTLYSEMTKNNAPLTQFLDNNAAVDFLFNWLYTQDRWSSVQQRGDFLVRGSIIKIQAKYWARHHNELLNKPYPTLAAIALPSDNISPAAETILPRGNSLITSFSHTSPISSLRFHRNESGLYEWQSHNSVDALDLVILSNSANISSAQRLIERMAEKQEAKVAIIDLTLVATTAALDLLAASGASFAICLGDMAQSIYQSHVQILRSWQNQYEILFSVVQYKQQQWHSGFNSNLSNLRAIEDFKLRLEMIFQYLSNGNLEELKLKENFCSPLSALRNFKGLQLDSNLSDFTGVEVSDDFHCFTLWNGIITGNSMRVLHRDLKPANIMLGSENRVLLGDLGLSRYFSEQTMEAFSKVGTPLYISPEVLTGNGYSFAADTWSLGCILYELCSLISPFKPQTEGVNLFQLFGNIKQGNFTPLRRNQLYSDELIGLVESMINLEPNNRPTLEAVCSAAAKHIPANERVKLDRPISAVRPLSAAAVLRPISAKSANTPTNIQQIATAVAAPSLQPITEVPSAELEEKAKEQIKSPLAKAVGPKKSTVESKKAKDLAEERKEKQAAEASATAAAAAAASAAEKQKVEQAKAKARAKAAAAEELQRQQQRGAAAAAEEAERVAMAAVVAQREALEGERIRLNSQMEQRDKRRKQGVEQQERNNHATTSPPGASNHINFIDVQTTSAISRPPPNSLPPSNQANGKTAKNNAVSKPPLPNTIKASNSDSNSRPQSSNPSSRPSSASRKREPFDIAAHPCDLIAEENLEKLKLLNYEQLFCRQYSFPWLVHNYFCVQQRIASSNRADNLQFIYFIYLSCWLVQHVSAVNSLQLHALLIQHFDRENQRDEVYVRDLAQRRTLISALVEAIKSNNIILTSIDLNVPELESGFGRSICLLLARLLDHIFMFRLFKPPNPKGVSTLSLLSGNASNPNSRPNSAFGSVRTLGNNISAAKWSLPAPIYAEEPVIIDGELNALEIEAGESEVKEEGEHTADDLEEDLNEPEAAADLKQETLSSPVPVANSSNTPAREWRLEYERVLSSKLLVPKKYGASGLNSSSLIDRLQYSLQQSDLLKHVTPTLSKQLTSHSSHLKQTLQHIETTEAQINRDSAYSAQQAQLLQNSVAMEKLQSFTAQLTASIAADTAELNRLEDAVQSAKQSIAQKTSATSDSGPLLQLRAATKAIQTDLAQLELRIQMAQSLTLQSSYKQHQQKQSAAAKSALPGVTYAQAKRLSRDKSH
jgi:serine/threonine protein kinase